MGLTRVQCDGYDSLVEQIRTVVSPEIRRTFVYFTGSKLADTGKSWCPDCVNAEPNVEAALAKVETQTSAETAFIICHVNRDYWKDKSNALRTNAKFLVKCVPTLLELNADGRRLSKDEEFASVETITKFML